MIRITNEVKQPSLQPIALFDSYEGKAFSFTEGATGNNKYFYFSERSGDWRVFRVDLSDMTLEMLNIDCDQPNGMFLRGHRLFICNEKQPQPYVSVWNLKEQVASKLIQEFNNLPLNSPNDLVCTDKDTLFFTDPCYSDKKRDLPQKGEYLYFQNRRGETKRFEEFVKPNGVILSPDESVLYVADPGREKVVRVYLDESGEPTSINDFIEGEVVDGMATDPLGNLYLAASRWGDPKDDHIAVYSKDGKKIGRIEVDAHPTNVALVANHSLLAVTTNRSVQIFQIEIGA
ncbi:MAG: SMP-30/gluconolactonase/LRE family protein [Pseudobacteriovorax sp.]|nr:SMP-30/gluconolactonase/LRE family protein [Pseudobacteriovorax sp.]